MSHKMPAAKYDALVEESVKWGGVREGQRFIGHNPENAPCCVVGMAEAAHLLPVWGNLETSPEFEDYHDDFRALFGPNAAVMHFDRCIIQVQESMDRGRKERVPLIPVLDLAGITRGEE